MSMPSSLDPGQGSGEASILSARNERSLGRAVLDQLRERKWGILNKLRRIGIFAPMWRDRIRASSPKSADFISRLPAEVLLLIIELVLQSPLVECDTHRHVKCGLASVSRHWRNLILNCPSLWNRIRIRKSWDVPFVKAHVARSAEYPLDIEFDLQCFTRCDWRALRSRLIAVFCCRYRWRSLVLKDINKDVILSSIFARQSVAFKRLTIIGDYQATRPFWFSPNVDWTSVDYLELRTCVDVNYLSNLSSLETLIIDFRNAALPPTHAAFSLRKLKTLSLSGYTGDLQFNPDTLHFPLLDFLSINVSHARELMEAIVAPNLRHVRYAPRSCDSDMSTIFGNVSSKFLSVERLSLCGYTEFCPTDRSTNVESAQAVSTAFIRVRHVELHARHIEAFFDTEAACPADSWEHLQVLTVENLFEDKISALKEWLRRRSLAGKPILDLVIVDIPSILSDSRPSALYESFRPYCNVVVALVLDPTSSLSTPVSTHPS
ncbi:hypothetical protein EDD17DRAFT_1753866 [Pisolithus thermaeus]|nr:hypothetical protein EDD17DRAFT_1753866 [Pisolithus thermaeus]